MAASILVPRGRLLNDEPRHRRGGKHNPLAIPSVGDQWGMNDDHVVSGPRRHLRHKLPLMAILDKHFRGWLR